MKDIERKCNLIVNLSKFTFIKKMLSRTLTLTTTKFVVKYCPKKIPFLMKYNIKWII